MRKGFLGSLATVALGAGLTVGQDYPPAGPGGGPPEAAFTSPDGHPIIPPPGFEGMIPPGSLPDGPGGPYPYGGGGGGGGYGSGPGIFEGGGGPPRLWYGADFLLWVPKSMPGGSTVVSTSGGADLGILGSPSARALFGDRNIGYGAANGFRAWLGMSFDEDGRTGFEFGGFLLESRAKSFRLASGTDGLPLIAVPVFDASTGANSSYLIAAPGIRAGDIRIDTQTRSWGAEGNFVFNLYRANPEEGSAGSIDLLAGGRFFELEERLSVATSTQRINPTLGNSFGGTTLLGSPQITTTDRTRTFNDFYGGNVGIRGDISFGRLYLGAAGKFGFGYMRQRVELEGGSSAGTSTVPGGLFNDTANLGKFRKDTFAVMPEGNFNIGYQITSRIRAQVGYTFLYVDRVLRPTAVNSSVVNTSFVPTATGFGTAPVNYTPRDLGKQSEFWLQGVNFGFNIQF